MLCECLPTYSPSEWGGLQGSMQYRMTATQPLAVLQRFIRRSRSGIRGAMDAKESSAGIMSSQTTHGPHRPVRPPQHVQE